MGTIAGEEVGRLRYTRTWVRAADRRRVMAAHISPAPPEPASGARA